MGRTNGKLVPFLKAGLQDDSFCNLKWEDRDAEIFSINIPRHDEKRDLSSYERLLIEWYLINNRGYQYPGYSAGKSVIQAALKKSPYLVPLGSRDKKQYYKFASKTEELEKRQRQKQKSKPGQNLFYEGFCLQYASEQHEASLSDESNLQSTPSSSPGPPLSPSSDYHSGNDDVDENTVTEHKMPAESEILDVLGDLFTNPDSYINALNDIGLDNEALSFNDIMEDKMDTAPCDIKSEGIQCIQAVNEKEFKPVEELLATEVHSPRISNTYWLCTKKVKIDSTLLLICEKQVIQDENQGFKPGQMYLNNVFEPGESYDLQKMFELNGKCFLFLLRSN